MDLKWEPGGVALGPGGITERVDGLEEMLQNVALKLNLHRGGLPYDPELGSGLFQLDPQEENSVQRAWALANETLMDTPGVRVVQASYDTEEKMWIFAVETPLGRGQVAARGKEETDGSF